MLNDNELRLANGKIITFNSDQSAGIVKIRAWLKNPKSNFFTLAGFAGTGKSSIVKKIIDSYRNTLAVSAPTHKAKKVIVNMTGEAGVTLHSLLGLRPDLDLDSFNPNDPKFDQIAKPAINNYRFIVIDEASMINIDLYEMLKEITDGSRIKILFMGDPAQIPPIGERSSAVFLDETIESHWLYKVERQKDDNPLLPMYDIIRDNLGSIYPVYERKTKLNKDLDGIIYRSSKAEFRKDIINRFLSNEYKNDTDYAKVIAWRNITVMKSNKTIRNAIFGSGVDIIEVGDVLMGYRSISAKRTAVNIIENSADYRVVEKGERTENKYGIFGYRVKFRENLTLNTFRFISVFIVDHSDHANLHQYGEMHDFLRDRGKENKKEWSKYYDLRRESMIMVDIKDYRNGDTRSSYEKIKKDLDYGYCLTGHKCQGSTYEHVFILEDDIMMNHNVRERNQIFYVSISRPIKTATVLYTANDENRKI